jgi:hypothetical protein
MPTTRNIPAAALTMTVGEFALGDNGENAKSAPVTITARSGNPIEHWYWGRIVHDLSGMRLSKSRVAIDYCHRQDEPIGYGSMAEAVRLRVGRGLRSDRLVTHREVMFRGLRVGRGLRSDRLR